MSASAATASASSTPSDEWYLKAGRPIPPAEFYEDFDQLENGVGMMRLFEDEFRAELDRPHRIYGTKQIDVVTGTMAGPLITEMMDELHRQYPMIDVKFTLSRIISLAATWAWRGLSPPPISLPSVRESWKAAPWASPLSCCGKKKIRSSMM